MSKVHLRLPRNLNGDTYVFGVGFVKDAYPTSFCGKLLHEHSQFPLWEWTIEAMPPKKICLNCLNRIAR